MRPRLRGLRRTREVEAVARARPGGIEMLPGVRTRAREVPGARRPRRVGPVSAAEVALHQAVRGLGGVDGRPLHRVGRGAGVPHRMAQRRRHLRAHPRRPPAGDGPRALRRRPRDRHRRDLVQEGPQVPHGRGGPRQGLPDLGRGGWSKEVLRRFLKEELTREQRLSIEVVTADGYRWI